MGAKPGQSSSVPGAFAVRRCHRDGADVAPQNAEFYALSAVSAKAHYWEKLRSVPLHERQRLVINRMLEGLEGKLTTSKWAALTKSSSDTALRDIQQLVERGVLVRHQAGGRSTNYARWLVIESTLRPSTAAAVGSVR